jgi:hypothetical protein
MPFKPRENRPALADAGSVAGRVGMMGNLTVRGRYGGKGSGKVGLL